MRVRHTIGRTNVLTKSRIRAAVARRSFAEQEAGFHSRIFRGLNGGKCGHAACNGGQYDECKKHAAQKPGVSRNSRIHNQSPKAQLSPASSPRCRFDVTALRCLYRKDIVKQVLTHAK
jgi:hypothetical protein